MTSQPESQRRQRIKDAIIVLLAEGVFDISDHGSHPRIEYHPPMEVGDKDAYSVTWETLKHSKKTQYKMFDTPEEATEFFLEKCEIWYGRLE